MKTARQTAFEILLKIEKNRAYSNIALDSAVRGASPDSTDCAFISRLVYGVTERKITLDYIFSEYLKQPAAKLKPELLTVLRMGTYQLCFADRIPASAAVNESVTLAKNNGASYAAGLVNAVLRKVSQNGFRIYNELDETERLSVEYSFPPELVRFFIHHYGREGAVGIFKASLLPKRTAARVNTLKTDAASLVELLGSEGVAACRADIENALYLELNSAVYELQSFQNGLFHVEDISSQLCVKALGAQPGERVLDVCSAPGGKSFTAAQYMNNLGSIVSCDLYPQRVSLIKSGAGRLGIEIINADVNDAAVFNPVLGDFDRVLCDVPCSGLGIITKKPEIKYKSLDDIKQLIPIQKQILDTSCRYVKSGGSLVYSTCSLNPNENRRVCDAFLKEHPEFHSVSVLPELPRLVDEGDYITLTPHINNCDGFFIAAFVRE